MLTSAAEAVEGAEQWRERHYLIRSWSPGSNEGDLSSRRAAGSLSAWRNTEAAEERAPTLPTETQPRVTSMPAAVPSRAPGASLDKNSVVGENMKRNKAEG